MVSRADAAPGWWWWSTWLLHYTQVDRLNIGEVVTILYTYTEISHRGSCATHCDDHIITRSQIVQKVQDRNAEFSHGRLVVLVERKVIILYTGSGGQVIKYNGVTLLATFNPLPILPCNGSVTVSSY
jgi:hypothetical protein